MTAAVTRLNAVARKQGWRVLWVTEDVRATGWKRRVLEVVNAAGRRMGFAQLEQGRGYDEGAVSEELARMILPPG